MRWDGANLYGGCCLFIPALSFILPFFLLAAGAFTLLMHCTNIAVLPAEKNEERWLSSATRARCLVEKVEEGWPSSRDIVMITLKIQLLCPV